MGVHWKIWLLGGWCSWKTNIEGGFQKRGLGQFANWRGLGKKERVVFLRADWYPNAHYEWMVTSQMFQSQSFFRFLTQWQTKAEICWRTFCQKRWPENWMWFYCFQWGDKAYPYMMSWNFLISRYRKLNS